MRPVPLCVMGLGLALALSTAPAAAQRSILGFGGGVSFPTGEFNEEVDAGFHAGAFLNFPIFFMLGMRVETSYHRFGSDLPGDDPFILPILLALTFELPVPGTANPYLVGGTGVYYLKRSDSSDDNELGWNLGAGIALSRFFVEARYHYVFDRGDEFVPLTLGLRL